jgi:hypothetical protein
MAAASTASTFPSTTVAVGDKPTLNLLQASGHGGRGL